MKRGRFVAAPYAQMKQVRESLSLVKMDTQALKADSSF